MQTKDLLISYFSDKECDTLEVLDLLEEICLSLVMLHVFKTPNYENSEVSVRSKNISANVISTKKIIENLTSETPSYLNIEHPEELTIEWKELPTIVCRVVSGPEGHVGGERSVFSGVILKNPESRVENIE